MVNDIHMAYQQRLTSVCFMNKVYSGELVIVETVLKQE